MKTRNVVHGVLGCAMAIAIGFGSRPHAQAPLTIDGARITISGTSNIHEYTASTTTVRVTRAELADGVLGPDLWTGALKPGGVNAFEVTVPAKTLTSPREGLDKNMHKALLVAEHPEIGFRLLRIEPAANGSARAVGVLRVAGVEREVTFSITSERKGATLAVQGTLQLLMTDFGIKPPTAMLGMLKTDPKVTVKFETVLAVPLT